MSRSFELSRITCTKRAETAAVSRGTSRVTIKLRCKYITSVDIKNKIKTRYKRLVTYVESQATAVSLLERYIKAINNVYASCQQ